MTGKKEVCSSTSNPLCKRPELQARFSDRANLHITQELIAALAACGLGCKGAVAEVVREKGTCGLIGAIIEAHGLGTMDFDLNPPYRGATYAESCDVMSGIVAGGVDPSTVITNVPKYLAP